MLAPGSTIPANSVVVEGAMCIVGSADTKLEKQYLRGADLYDL